VLDEKGICVTKTAAKAYLCKPSDVAECVAQCKQGSGQSCYNAAMGQYHKGVHSDMNKAREAATGYYKQGCGHGHQRSCVSLAGLLRSGSGADKPEAKKLYTTACERGEALACLSLVSAFEHGSLEEDRAGFKPDMLEAMLKLRKACDLGNGLGCSQLAQWYIAGKGIARPDPAKGLQALDRSCRAGDPFNCFQLAEHQRKGTAGAKDPKKAEQLHRRMCEQKRSNQACTALGQMYRKGEGVAKSPAMAQRYLVRACPLEGSWGGAACVELGSMYQTGDGVASDELQAMKLYQRSCKPDVPFGAAGCYEIATLLDGGGKSVKKDPDKAASYFGRACNYSGPPGDDSNADRAKQACARAVALFQQQKEDASAAAHARTGCFRYKDQRLCALAKKLGPPRPPGPPRPAGPPPVRPKKP
jgi:hypothetical protein